MPHSDDQLIARINALTQNARSTWFALLSVLLFVGITLMGVEHIDFYGVDRATQLPLINVSVPTPLFFYAAPLLTTAVFCYFHLYLIRLWDALGAASPRVNRERLGDAVAPWLITDAALFVRRLRREDLCASPRTMEGASMVLNALLAWVGGWFVLAWIGYKSLPAREFEMTAIASLSLVAAVFAGISSLVMAWQRMGASAPEDQIWFWSFPAKALALLVFVLVSLGVAFLKTDVPDWYDKLPFLARLQMTDPYLYIPEMDLVSEDLVSPPTTWKSHRLALAELEDTECTVGSNDRCPEEANWYTAISHLRIARTAEIRTFEKATVSDLDPAELTKKSPSQLRKELKHGVDLSKTDLRAAKLTGLNLAGARFIKSKLNHADLEAALPFLGNLEGATLDYANLAYAIFFGANLKGASLRGIYAWETNFVGAIFVGSQISDGLFFGANLRSARLWSSRVEVSLLSGSKFKPTDFANSSLIKTSFHGTAFHRVSFEQTSFEFTDLSHSFGYAHEDQLDQLFPSGKVPCQWITGIEPPSDREFFSRWRGWLEAYPKDSDRFKFKPSSWQRVAPIKWHSLPPTSPAKGCIWTKPLSAHYSP